MRGRKRMRQYHLSQRGGKERDLSLRKGKTEVIAAFIQPRQEPSKKGKEGVRKGDRFKLAAE